MESQFKVPKSDRVKKLEKEGVNLLLSKNICSCKEKMKPLTYEEINKIAEQIPMSGFCYLDFARAIEKRILGK